MEITGNITTEIYSQALGRPVQISARLPVPAPGKKLKTVYMIPGALESSEALFTDMDVASGFVKRNLDEVALIMVSPGFGFLADFHEDYRYAHQYYTFITQELVEITRTLFPLSARREDTGIYGFSMGGFGAFCCGLNNPQLYGYVGSQSGMLDMQWALENRPFMKIKHRRQFGSSTSIRGTQYDLFELTTRLNAQKAAGDSIVPRIYQSWGREDYLRVPNEAMHRHLMALDLDYTYYFIEGIHSWGPGNSGVYLYLDWFLGREGKEGDTE